MPNVDPRILELLASAHQRELSNIQIASEAAVEDAWLSLDSFDGDAEDQWSRTFLTITSAAVAASAISTWSYLSMVNRYVGVSAPLRRPSTGWFANDFAKWGALPIVRARTLSPEFGPGAVAEVSETTRKLVTAATREAEQRAFTEIVDSIEWVSTFEYTDETPDDRPVVDDLGNLSDVVQRLNDEGYPTTKRNGSALRWRRMTQSGACGFCRVLADRRYSDKAKDNKPTGAYHTYCRCTWRKITADESVQWQTRYDQTRWKDIIDERFDESAANQGNAT